PARRLLRSRELWLGAGIALLIILPNILWHWQHHWAALEFYPKAQSLKNNPTGPLLVLLYQILSLNPFLFPLWAGGVYYLLAGENRKYAPLGWMYLAMLLLMMLGQTSRLDRLTPAYAILFAAGAVFLENLLGQYRLAWVKPVYTAVLLASDIILLPFLLPVLPVEKMEAYMRGLGVKIVLERGYDNYVPSYLARRIGWEKVVDEIAAVYHRLPPADQARTVIIAYKYGYAGALEMYGKKHNLPRVLCGHIHYYYWADKKEHEDIFLTVGIKEQFLQGMFDSVELAGTYHDRYEKQGRQKITICLCRHPRLPFEQLWPYFKVYR
ncbi:hypothetical protein JW933_07130, partial [candidate division FCPU426 bacterium]|nr:hypothetical protein [candidate division FCPU426 bacterium]